MVRAADLPPQVAGSIPAGPTHPRRTAILLLQRGGRSAAFSGKGGFLSKRGRFLAGVSGCVEAADRQNDSLPGEREFYAPSFWLFSAVRRKGEEWVQAKKKESMKENTDKPVWAYETQCRQLKKILCENPVAVCPW